MFRTLWRAAREWNNDNASFLGAALAYYSLFSIAPLLLLVFAITGLVLGEAAVEDRVFGYLKDFVGADSAKAVQQLVLSASKPTWGSWQSILASCILIYAALSLFRQLKTALNIVWKLPTIHHYGIVGFFHDLLLAVILVLCTGLFVLFMTLASMVTAFLAEFPMLHVGPKTWKWIDFSAVTVFQAFILGFTYRLLSEGRIRYRHVCGGAITAAILLTAGKWAFSYYLQYSRFDTVYGAAGSIIIFLVWVYYSAQIVFYGAEVVKVRMQQTQAKMGLAPSE